MLTLLRGTLKLHGKLGDMKSPICVTNKKINMFMICANNCIHSVYYHTDKFYKPINHSRVHCVGGLKASLFSLCISRVFFSLSLKNYRWKKKIIYHNQHHIKMVTTMFSVSFQNEQNFMCMDQKTNFEMPVKVNIRHGVCSRKWK